MKFWCYVFCALALSAASTEAKPADDSIIQRFNKRFDEAKECNGDNTGRVFRGLCYTLHSEPLNWRDARRACQKMGADLADPNKGPLVKFINVFLSRVQNENSGAWTVLKAESEVKGPSFLRSAASGKIFKEFLARKSFSEEDYSDMPGRGCVAVSYSPDGWSKMEVKNCHTESSFICQAETLEDPVTLRKQTERAKKNKLRQERAEEEASLKPVGVPNIIDTDILLRPVEVDMKELGADPMSGEHREEAQSVQVDPNGIHSRKRKKRNAVSIEAYLWPGGVVPYVFATGYKSETAVREAMDVIMEETCIQYRPKEADDENWMQIGEESPGCFAMIGRGNTETTVNLAADCTNAMGRVQHELLHALGFWHEHSRSDRDDYVTVVWENIQEDSADNFEKRTSNIDNQNIGYDYGSVMHYAEDFFTKVEGEPTLVTSRPEGAAIGQRVLMSPSDYAGVNIRYGCPNKINGGWSEWSSWSHCSKVCGTGRKSRTRVCDSPPPTNGGAECEGDAEEKIGCNKHECSAEFLGLGCWQDEGTPDLLKSLEEVGTKPAVLDGDYDSREDPITKCHQAAVGAAVTVFAVKDGGKCLIAEDAEDDYTEQGASGKCENGEGSDVAISVYTTETGAVNGQWTEWGVFSHCSVTCGGGIKQRSRVCNNPPPTNGGISCEGDATEFTACNTEACPVDGGWSEWTKWTDCADLCGLEANATRTRYCNNPPPQNGGSYCELVHDFEWLPCCSAAKPCTECTDAAVDGGWGDWRDIGECSASCGGGLKPSVRSCDNPMPNNGGADCDGNATKVEACNQDPCGIDGGWGEWGEYSECSVTCGDGTMFRTRECNNPEPSGDGQDCIGLARETVPCTHTCLVDGGWTEWTWTECSVTCGSGDKSASRKCTNPKPAYGGAECVGASTQNTVCNLAQCPINTILPGSSYALPASVPQPVITQPFDELVTNYVRGTPKDFRYGGGQPTAVAGKLDGAVLLDNGATVYRGFGSEPFGECMCSPELCSNGLSICLWFQQTPDQREASRQYIPNTVFSTGVENVGELIQGSGVGLFLRSSGLMKAMVRTPQKQFTADLPAYLFENSSAWHPVCITFKNDTGLKTYYKGQIRDWDEHGLDVTGALTITDRLIFGRPYQRADHYFYGTFDNFFMWTRELDSTQIDDIYQEAPTACEDCDPNAECVVAGEDTTCTCKAGFDGDGRSCQKLDEDVDDTEVDEATKCWLFEDEDSTPDVGETADWNDNGLLTGPGIQGRGVILNGRISWLNAGNFSEKCLSDPGLCASGLTVNYWIRYEGRGNYDNYIFSSGGRGAKNTGFCCWVLGTTMTCRLQKKDRRWQATTEILRGKWQMQTIIWTEEGLQIMIDGVKVGEDVTGRDRTVKKEEPTILAIGSANHYFGLTGRFDMDNLALWYKALTAEEVTAIYKDGVTCP